MTSVIDDYSFIYFTGKINLNNSSKKIEVSPLHLLMSKCVQEVTEILRNDYARPLVLDSLCWVKQRFNMLRG